MKQQQYFDCSSRHAFGPAANPLNNFSPLHLLTRTECLSDPHSRISQAVHFREPVKTQWFNMLKSPQLKRELEGHPMSPQEPVYSDLRQE